MRKTPDRLFICTGNPEALVSRRKINGSKCSMGRGKGRTQIIFPHALSLAFQVWAREEGLLVKKEHRTGFLFARGTRRPLFPKMRGRKRRIQLEEQKDKRVGPHQRTTGIIRRRQSTVEKARAKVRALGMMIIERPPPLLYYHMWLAVGWTFKLFSVEVG